MSSNVQAAALSLPHMLTCIEVCQDTAKELVCKVNLATPPVDQVVFGIMNGKDRFTFSSSTNGLVAFIHLVSSLSQQNLTPKTYGQGDTRCVPLRVSTPYHSVNHLVHTYRHTLKAICTRLEQDFYFCLSVTPSACNILGSVFSTEIAMDMRGFSPKCAMLSRVLQLQTSARMNWPQAVHKTSCSAAIRAVPVIFLDFGPSMWGVSAAVITSQTISSCLTQQFISEWTESLQSVFLHKTSGEEQLQHTREFLSQRILQIVSEFNQCKDSTTLIQGGHISRDSVAIVNLLTSELGYHSLPGTLLIDYPNITSLVDYLLNTSKSVSKMQQFFCCSNVPGASASSITVNILRTYFILPERFSTSTMCSSSDIKFDAVHSTTRMGSVAKNDSKVYTLHTDFAAELHCCHLFDIDAHQGRIRCREAKLMDPQQRLLLSLAGILCTGENNIMSVNSSVTVGISWVDYADICQTHVGIQTSTASCCALSVASGRLSYTYALQGPALSVDTACSSSLVAWHVATSDMRLKGSSSAVVGGVNLTLLAATTAMFASAGMLSRDGRCKTLDICADGYVRGEACEVALLGEASAVPPAALAAPGSAVNQDGRSSSLTAPNGPAQQRVVAAALALARASPSQVASLHMHGTGTALGDPVEAAAACEVLCTKPRASAASTAGRLPLQLAAGKSYVGHSECAAGLTGALLAVLGVEHHSSRSVLHLRAVNTHVAAAVGAVSRASVLPRECSALRFGSEAGASVYAGVSSFAFQGTNAHAVVSGKCGAACRGLARTAAATRASQVQRCWVVCEAAMLAERVLSWCTSAGAATLVSELGTPIHAALRDHRVQGRALCAGAALLECASAGCESLCSEDAAVGAARVLKDGILPVPLVLHEGAESRVELLCSVADTSTQFVEVRSARAEQRQVHLAASTCWQGARGLASGLVATKKRFCCFSITSFFDCYTIASMCFSAHFGFGAEGCLSLSCTDIDCLSFTHNHTTDGNNDTFAWIFDFPYTLYQSVMVFASFTTKLTIHTKTCKKSSTTKTFLEKNTLAGESFRSLPLCDLFSDRNYFASYASSLDLFHQLNYRCKFSTINQNGHSISCLQKKMQTVITLHSSPILEDSQRYNFAGRRAAAIFCILQTRPFLGMNRKVRVRLSAPRLVNCGDSLLKVLSTWSKEVSEVCLDKCAHLGATTPFICRPMPAEHTCAQPFAEGSAAYEARAVLSTIYYTTRRDKHLFNFPVITGGLGAVGGIISKWITQAYKDVKRVLLLSSTASTKAKLKSLAEYGAYAPAVSQLLIDVGTAGEQELRHIKKFGAINLFHASGILRDAASWNTTPALLTKLHAPKALGAQRLCCALFGSRVNSLIHFFTCSYNRS